jgi:hypothetical protein
MILVVDNLRALWRGRIASRGVALALPAREFAIISDSFENIMCASIRHGNISQIRPGEGFLLRLNLTRVFTPAFKHKAIILKKQNR